MRKLRLNFNFSSDALQALVLPRTTILLLLFLTAFIWIAVILMLLLAVRLRSVILQYFSENCFPSELPRICVFADKTKYYL